MIMLSYSTTECSTRTYLEGIMKKLTYFFSFMMPVAIMLVIFFIRDIYPFGSGERSFLHIDMYHQYLPFLTEFYHKVYLVSI